MFDILFNLFHSSTSHYSRKIVFCNLVLDKNLFFLKRSEDVQSAPLHVTILHNGLAFSVQERTSWCINSSPN